MWLLQYFKELHNAMAPACMRQIKYCINLLLTIILCKMLNNSGPMVERSGMAVVTAFISSILIICFLFCPLLLNKCNAKMFNYAKCYVNYITCNKMFEKYNTLIIGYYQFSYNYIY